MTCGSETLYRGNFTGDELLDKINTVKDQLPGIKVGTADSWNKYADGTADALITGGVELLYVHSLRKGAFADNWLTRNVGSSTASPTGKLSPSTMRLRPTSMT